MILLRIGISIESGYVCYLLVLFVFFFFFFQAEDGIRDDLVTGVQTCALPILNHLLALQHVFLAEYFLVWGILLLLAVGFCWLIEVGTGDRASSLFASRLRSEERRVGKSVDLGGRRRIKNKKKEGDEMIRDNT